MRTRRQLVFWGLIVLIAMAGLARVSPSYRRIFDPSQAPEWLHVLVHLVLYAGLVLLFLGAFEFSSDKKALLAVLGMVIIVAVVQELAQSLSMGILPLGGSLFDLGVDMAGGLIGLAVFGGIKIIGS